MAGTAIASLALIARGFRGVLGSPGSRVFGTSTDSLHAAWVHWWLAQPGTAEGSVTTLVSFPTGEVGSVVTPLATRLARPLFLLFGAPLAHSATTAGYMLFDGIAVGLLASRISRDRGAGLVAALAFLSARPAFAQAGMGAVDGIAVGWVALAAWMAVDWLRGTHPRLAGLGIGALLAVSVVENPYAVGVAVPLAAVLGIARLLRPGGRVQVAQAVVSGIVVTGARLAMVGQGLGGNTYTSVPMQFLGWSLPSVRVSYTVGLWQYFRPPAEFGLDGPPTWVLDQGGAAFLCVVPLLLAAWSLVAGGWGGRLLVLAGAACGLLGAGPWPWGQGPPGPFFWMNALLAATLHPLTQPVRYTAFVALAAAGAAGVGYGALVRGRGARWRLAAGAVVGALLVGEGLWHGGPSLQVPFRDLSPYGCLADLDRGAVHLDGTAPAVAPGTISATAVTTDPERANLSMALQMVHGRPATHRGLGGWVQQRSDARFEGDQRTLERLPPSQLARTAGKLSATGLDWILVDDDDPLAAYAVADRRCGGLAAVYLRTLMLDVPSTRR